MKKKSDIDRTDKTDWNRVESMQDENIDTSDIPVLDEKFFKNAQIRNPVEKTKISIRIDNDVLDFFKSQDGKYQTKINSVLRTYFETMKKSA